MKGRSILYSLPMLSLVLFACGGGPVAEENEDDVIVPGKADAVGFTYGFYRNLAVGEIDGEPLLLAFHKDSQGIPAGYAGQFDSSTYVESDFSTKYQSGYFKLYRYAGRTRIRLDSYDGKTTGRFDWAYSNRDLTFGDYTLRLLQQVDPIPVRECHAFEVLNMTILEESFSVWEYPNVSLNQTTEGKVASLGSSYYYTSEDETIEYTEQPNGDFEAFIKPMYGEIFVVRVPAQTPSRGEVLYAQEAGKDPRVIAKIVCYPPANTTQR